MDHPDYFLNLIFHNVCSLGEDLALCAGFERGEWRNDQFAGHVMEWLPEFALNHSELNEIGFHNAVRMTKKALQKSSTRRKNMVHGESSEKYYFILQFDKFTKQFRLSARFTIKAQ